MFKKFSVLLLAALTILSCSVKTETTYYKDAASSMESHILMDPGSLGMLGMLGGSKMLPEGELKKLSTDWKSLYDIQKDGLVTLNKDSVQVLKKLFVKLNKSKGEIYGLSLKYDKLLPGEITSLFRQSKELKNLPLQNVATWNGKSMTIDTEKFNSTAFLAEMAKSEKDAASAPPKTKSDSVEAYGRQMAQGMLGLMKTFNVNFTNTIKFQKPIKSITGKHDFVKQLDNRTIQINVRSKEMLEGSKDLINKDKKILITTE